MKHILHHCCKPGHCCMRQGYLIIHLHYWPMKVKHSRRLIFDATYYHPIAVYIKHVVYCWADCVLRQQFFTKKWYLPYAQDLCRTWNSSSWYSNFNISGLTGKDKNVIFFIFNYLYFWSKEDTSGCH